MSLLNRTVAWLVVCLAVSLSSGNAQVPLAISDFHVDVVGRAVVRVPSEAGFYFILYRGDEITAIQAATDVESLPSAGDPPSVELIDTRPPTPLPSRFYRVERVPLATPKDADGDGVDDVYELNARPLLDPLNPTDAALDPDNDGPSTLEEYRSGTNPFVANPPPAPASPRLNPPGSSTTAGRLELTGFGAANTYIRVEGGAALATNRVGADGAFSLLVPLSTNRINRLFVTALNPQGNTSPGVPIEILQDSQPATLHVDFPTNRMTFTTGNTLVAGRVGDSLSGYAGLSVWVHASPAEGNPPLASTSFPPNSPLQATVDVGIGPNGTYERGDVPLVEGTNIVSVVAMDALGNRTVRRAEVIRRPLAGPRLVMRSGDRQMTNVLRRLEQPLVVRAENPDGSPIANVLLTLDVTRSDGRLLPANTNALASDWTLQPNATTNGAMVIQVRTDANGEAAAWWTLGSEAGCANNRVCVRSGVLDACVYFCASAMGNPGRQINIGSGNHQKVETGGATVEPLRAWVSDGLNPAGNVPVTFRVVEGNGRLVEGGRDGLALASRSPSPAGAGPEGSSLTVATGRTGHASVGFVAGSDAGQNVIEASFPGQFGLPATFIVYGVARDLTQPATFTGLILDNTSCPIGNAYCELEVAHYKVGTFSDGQGRFRFENVPGGMGHLHVNGRTATSVFTNAIPTNSFPALHYSVTTVPNAENSLPSPVLLPRLNPANAHVYDGTKDLVLTCEGIDGLKMTILANSMRDPQGNPVTPANPMVVSLDQVHHDDVPMPMPDGVAPAFAWTLQPGGATFDPPVTIEYPNMSGLPPGSIAYFLSFNHDTERFEIVSSGHITDDGSTIVTDPGSGLTLAGWGCNCPPYAVTGSCCYSDDPCMECREGKLVAKLNGTRVSECEVCLDGKPANDMPGLEVQFGSDGRGVIRLGGDGNALQNKSIPSNATENFTKLTYNVKNRMAGETISFDIIVDPTLGPIQKGYAGVATLAVTSINDDTGELTLIGLTPTEPGYAGKLRIRAKSSLEQCRVAMSEGFSVCGHFHASVLDRSVLEDIDTLVCRSSFGILECFRRMGVEIKHRWRVDGGEPRLEYSELVSLGIGCCGGGFPSSYKSHTSNLDYKDMGIAFIDRNYFLEEDIIAPYRDGEIVFQQLFLFNCHRCGEKNAIMPNSGFVIKHRVLRSGGDWVHVSTKEGSAVAFELDGIDYSSASGDGGSVISKLHKLR